MRGFDPKLVVLPALAAWIVSSGGCGPAPHRAWGETVDTNAAVPLSRVLTEDTGDGAMVTVSGRIGEVCRSAGCWFVLQDTADGKAHELLVDLKPAASFTVPADVSGSDAVVRGRLVGSAPDRALHAVGLVLE